MQRFLFAAGAFALLVPMATAQNQPEPAQPPAKREGRDTRPGRPAQNQPAPFDRVLFPPSRLSATRLAALEEEVELTEAQRDVRRAHVRAAQVAVKGADAQFQLLSKVPTLPPVDRIKAETEVEAARAQLEIKEAELKEIEIKVKHAKKRLADLKDAVRPAPARPGAIDPPPAPGGGGRGRDRGAGEPPPSGLSFNVSSSILALAGTADEKLIEALKADIAKHMTQAKKQQEEIKKAESLLKDAEKEAAKAPNAEARKLAQAKVEAVKKLVELQRAKARELEKDIARLKEKLKEVEKK